MKPLSPQEILNSTQTNLHPSMIEVVNTILLRYRKGYTLNITQKEIVDAFLLKEPSYTEDQMIAEKLLDIESTFERVGWIVKYDKPGYDETSAPFYKFTT